MQHSSSNNIKQQTTSSSSSRRKCCVDDTVLLKPKASYSAVTLRVQILLKYHPDISQEEVYACPKANNKSTILETTNNNTVYNKESEDEINVEEEEVEQNNRCNEAVYNPHQLQDCPCNEAH